MVWSLDSALAHLQTGVRVEGFGELAVHRGDHHLAARLREEGGEVVAPFTVKLGKEVIE